MASVIKLIEEAMKLDRLAVKAMDMGKSDALVNSIFDRADKAWDKVEAAEAAATTE